LNEALGRLPKRASAVLRFADLRPTDHVLDVGCADGSIALEVARWVERVHGFDISPTRVARASRSAAEAGIENATFEAISVQDFPFEPDSWDVTMFMRVWGKGSGTKTVGAEELARILGATRRQLILLANVHSFIRAEPLLATILEVCDQNQFDALCSSRPNLIIANRRGTDARLGELPKLALVPTALLPDHPVVMSSPQFGKGDLARGPLADATLDAELQSLTRIRTDLANPDD
jgi:SAM-dependent methyltransferase